MRGEQRSARSGRAGSAWSALGALALANLRYWPKAAPATRRALAAWEQPAAGIAEPHLRSLALAKLRDERFNAEVAATLATLAPARTRLGAVRAIVALELLFDYLDGRTERPSDDPLDERRRLFGPFLTAIDRPAGASGRRAEDDEVGRIDDADGGYLRSLSQQAQTELWRLPAATRVADHTRKAARRCAEAQTRLHAAATLGDAQLRDWALADGSASGLDWLEYLGGAASSVLSVHALIAAAADPGTSTDGASRIDAAYLAIGGVITILDSVIDQGEDSARGEPGFIRLFESRQELHERLRALTREALARAWEAPHGGHHAMTLAGVAAYYTTHPGAEDPRAREITQMVCRELSPTIWPTLGVLRAWRAAKHARANLNGRRARRHDVE